MTTYGYVIFKSSSYFNYIGRIAFPLFAFQLVQGYNHTKNIGKYMKKMLIFACIAQIPFMLFLSTFSRDLFKFNVLFTFIIAIFSIDLYKKQKNKSVGILYVLLASVLAEFIKADYGMYGVLLIFIFYIFKDNKKLMYSSAIIITFIKYLISFILAPAFINTYLIYFIFTCISFIFIAFYNNKEGKKIKYLFYIYYPLHFTILWLINMFIK